MTIKSIRIFLIALILAFLMVVIPHLGSRSSRNIELQTTPGLSTPDVLKKLRPQLEFPKNTFQLKKPFVPLVSAGSDYDQAAAYGLIDYDSGEVIAAKNLSDQLPMASLTKIMTAVVSLDLASSDEEFIVSKQAALAPPTKVMLKPGEKYSLKQLLSFMLISSANDSAQVIQEGIDRKFGQDVFIKAMNQKTTILGLKHTHFINAPGLDDINQYSSIEDLSILSHYAMENYPLIAQLVGESSLDLTNNNDLRFYLNNWNGLLGIYPGVSGIKIGNTQNAGNCTIVLSKRADKQLLTIILGAPDVLERDLWTSELLDLGFSKLAGLPPIGVTEDQLKKKYASWKYY